MKQLKKAMTVLLLSALMTSALASCGGGEEESSGGTTGGASAVAAAQQGELLAYRENPVDVKLSMKMSDIRGMFHANDRIYVWGTPYDEEKGSNLTVEDFQLTDETSHAVTLPPEKLADAHVMSVTADQDGNLYATYQRWSWSGGGEEAILFEGEDDAEMTQEAGAEDAAEEGTKDLPEENAEDAAEGDTKDLPEENAEDAAEGDTNDAPKEDAEADAPGEAEEEEPGKTEDAPAEAEPEEMQGSATTGLLSLDPEGNIRWDVSLDEEEKKEDYYGGEYFAACSRTGQHDVLIVSGGGRVSAFNPEDGTKGKELYKCKEEYATLMAATMRDGKVAVYGYDNQELALLYDPAKGELAEGELKIPMDVGIWGMHPGVDHDFYVESGNGISVLDIGSEKAEKLVSYTDSDLMFNYVRSILGLPEGILILYDASAEMYSGTFGGYGSVSDGNEGAMLSLLTKVPAEELADKQIITLGTTFLSTPVTRGVVKFNKENTKYRIRIIDYSAYANESNWNGDTEQLNNDIISGNMPDMVALNMRMPTDQYYNKGVFRELDDLIANDPELSQTEFLDNIIDAFRYHGKLYTIVPSFGANCVAIRKDIADSLAGWTVQDVERLVEEGDYTWQTLFGWNYPREYLLQAIVMQGGKEFVDPETHSCNFNSDSFKQLLEFAAHFPSEEEWQQQMNEEIDWVSQETAYRSGKALLNATSLYDFDFYKELRYVTYGAPIEMIGFPIGTKGAGNTISAEMQLAMSASTAYEEACWEFMRSYLLPEFQESIEYSFPVTVSALEKKAEEARKPRTYKDEDGKEQIVEQRYSIGGEEVLVPQTSKEDTDFVIGVLKSMTESARYDQQLLNIITEETAPYFKGQKSAEEVMQIIQNRAQIYISEQG